MTETAPVSAPVVSKASELKIYLRKQSNELADAKAILEIQREAIDQQLMDVTLATQAVNAALDRLETNQVEVTA